MIGKFNENEQAKIIAEFEMVLYGGDEDHPETQMTFVVCDQEDGEDLDLMICAQVCQSDEIPYPSPAPEQDMFTNMPHSYIVDEFNRVALSSANLDFADEFGPYRRRQFNKWMHEELKHLDRVRRELVTSRSRRDQIVAHIIRINQISHIITEEYKSIKDFFNHPQSRRVSIFDSCANQILAPDNFDLIKYSLNLWNKERPSVHNIFSRDPIDPLLCFQAMQSLALHATLHGNLTEALIYLGTLLEFNDEQHVEVTSILLRKLLEHHKIPLPAYMQSSSQPPTNKAKTTNIEIDTTVYSMQDPASQKIIIAKETIQSSSSDPDEDMAKKYANLMQPLPIHIPTMNTDDIALALDREYPWMANITAHLLPSVRRHQQHALKGPLLGPVILVGAPGSGKTSYLRRLAELLGTKCTVISLAGMDNNMLLKGAARTWNRAEPSQIVRLINESGQANPMVILDEIEKASKESRQGNVYDALLQLIDTKDSEVYFDQYLAVPVDLSRVSYLATANSTQDIHSALKSRINVLQVTGPTKADFLSVAQAKWFQYFSNIGLAHSMPPFNAELFRRLLTQVKDLRDVGRMFDAVLKSELEDIPLLRTH